MNSKTFYSLCMALLLAPALMAQTERGDAPWQFAQASVPVRRIPTTSSTPPPSLVVPTNRPSPLIATNRPVVHAPAGPPAFGAPAPAASLPTIPAIPLNAVQLEPARQIAEVADITYNFPAVPMDQLLDIYADLIGRTLLRATAGPESVLGASTITLKTETKLTHSEAIVALETVLGMNGVTIIPIGDKFAKVVSEASAGAAGGVFTTNTNNLPIAGKFITEILQIKYADIKDLTEALQLFAKGPKAVIGIPSTDTLILRDYAENVARMMEMVAKIDVLTPNSIKPEVIPIKYALAADIASALSALGASGGTSVGKSSSGANFKGGTGTAAGGTSGGFGNSTGGAGSSYPGQAAGSGNSGMGSGATSGRSAFQQNLQRAVASAAGGSGSFQLFGQTKIIADERTNSLLVFANDEDMKMIKIIIDKLDVVLPQVLIDAIIMEINLQDTRNTGVSTGTQNGGANGFSGIGGLNNLSSAASGFLTGSSTTNNTANAQSGSTLANLPGGFSYFGRFGNDINVVLEAVAGDSRINVLSRPRIQTSHAVQADLFIGNTVPYVTGTQNYGYGAGPSSTYTQLEVGIHLQVLPLINKDGLVVMDIQADVEQLGPDVQIAGVGGVPTTTKRQAGAKVAVRNGETIILGGFISDSRSKAISGIPGLMNIPYLGNLFRTTSIENLRTELVMLMRPTVLPSPEIAAVVATEERNKLSGVKQAEWEIRTDETKRNLKIERDMAAQAAREAAAVEKAAKKRKAGVVDPSTNTIPLNSIPAIEDQ
jgi:general secretion pathway protein D